MFNTYNYSELHENIIVKSNIITQIHLHSLIKSLENFSKTADVFSF